MLPIWPPVWFEGDLKVMVMAVGHDRRSAVCLSETAGRDLAEPRSFETSWIDECYRTSLRQRCGASSLDTHATDDHALYVPWCQALLSCRPTLPWCRSAIEACVTTGKGEYLRIPPEDGDLKGIPPLH
jgi:hypothetical protein